MRVNLFILAWVAATFLSATFLPAAETPHDGAFWQASSSEAKQFYVNGVISGILFGQDRVVRRSLPGESQAPFAPECHRAAVGMVNSLEREIGQWDPAQVVAALDRFYEDPANRRIRVRWALMAVLLEMDGSKEKGPLRP
jgi:hypothetical protein